MTESEQQQGQQIHQRLENQQEQVPQLSQIPMVESKHFKEDNNNERQEEPQSLQKIKLTNRSESMNTPNKKIQKNQESSQTDQNKSYTPQYGSGMKKNNPSSTNIPNFKKYNLDSPNRSSTFKNLTTGDEKQMTRSNMFLIQSPTNQNLAGGHSQMTTMSNFHSASTLRYSTTTVSFTKAERFLTEKYAHSGTQYNLPPVRDTKATSFGFGEKRILPQYLVKNAEEIPSPAKYSTHRSLGQLPTAKSFGLAYKYYAKTYIPKVTIKEPEASRDIPGVGHYNINEQFADNKLKYSLYGKGIVFQDINPSCSPPCNQYSPSERLIKQSRYSDLSFGFGKKYDFTKVTKNTPGPGTYVMPSAFDKYKNKKLNHRVVKSVSRTVHV